MVAQLDAELPQNVTFMAAIDEARAQFEAIGASTVRKYADRREESEGSAQRVPARSDDLAEEDSGPTDHETLLSPRDVPPHGHLRLSYEPLYRPPANLLRGASVLAEILSSSVFLRMETRQTSLATLKAFPFDRPNSPGGSDPVGGMRALGAVASL